MKKDKRFFAFIGSAIRSIRHVHVKIWLAAAVMGLVCILVIALGAQALFNNLVMESATVRMSGVTTSAGNAMSATIDNIVSRFVNICGTTEFETQFNQLRDTGKSGYAVLNNTLQALLTNLSACHPYVRAAVFTSRQGMAYHLISHSLVTLDYTMGYDERLIKSVTLLPTSDKLIKGMGRLMPLVIPLGVIKGGSLPVVAEDIASSVVVLFLFLDAEEMYDTLTLYDTENTNPVPSLLNNNGMILYETQDVAFTQTQLENLCAAANATENEGDTAVLEFGSQYAFCVKVHKRDLYLVNLVDHDELIAPLLTLQRNLLFAAVFSVLLAAIATLFSSSYLLRPLHRLTGAVKAIGEGQYSSELVLAQADEIGQLSAAVDQMYHTIQRQITQISDERQAKYNAEIRLIAEQINPHFLYNALEYINLEVYNRNNENASGMIQSLGDFMRIGLSFGSECIPLGKELEYVRAYVAIMNHRFAHDISLIFSVPESLLSLQILKIILQPLVENSIRHGFQLEGGGAFIETSRIQIKAILEDDRLTLSVIDNGIGFDVAKTDAILRGDTREHMGLHNVFQRLRLFYGDAADMELSSIPYYKNTVAIKIKLQQEQQAN